MTPQKLSLLTRRFIAVLALAALSCADDAMAFQGGRRGPAPPNPTVSPPTPFGNPRGGLAPATPTPTPPGAAWWESPAITGRLGLTEVQVKEVASIAEQYRQPLAQYRADLEREEAILNRMLNAQPMEPAAAISAQIDRVVEARGELERTNSRMVLAMRRLLTSAQWLQLQSEMSQTAAPAARGQRGGRRGGPVTPPSPPETQP